MKYDCSSSRMRNARRGIVKQPRTDEALKNDHGEIDYSNEDNWSVYLQDAYFAMRPARSSETMVSEQMTGAITHVLLTRFSATKAAIRPSMKILITRNDIARTLHVAGPPKNLDEADLWLEIPCIEEVPG